MAKLASVRLFIGRRENEIHIGYHRGYTAEDAEQASHRSLVSDLRARNPRNARTEEKMRLGLQVCTFLNGDDIEFYFNLILPVSKDLLLQYCEPNSPRQVLGKLI